MSQGVLLCLLPFPEPKALTQQLSDDYPGLEIRYQHASSTTEWTQGEKLADGTSYFEIGVDIKIADIGSVEQWKDVIILFTGSSFPARIDLLPKCSEWRGPTRFSTALIVAELIQLCSSGTDHVQHQPLYEHSSIPMTSAAGVASPMMAEWVVLSILAHTHRYDIFRSRQLEEEWDHADGAKAICTGLSSLVGKSIGILGYGSVGRQIAKVMKSMGMEVLAYTAHARTSPNSRSYQGYTIPGTGDSEGEIPSRWYDGCSEGSLHSFLAEVDILVVSVPLTPATRRLLGREEFAVLSQRRALVVSVSRGAVLDQNALIEALQAGKEGGEGLSGAVLDSTEPEPLPKHHPLWTAPNCSITPHISAISADYIGKCFGLLRENIERLQQKRSLVNEIDRKVGYAVGGHKSDHKSPASR